MKIATILFTYNRSWHTEIVLEALRNNKKKPDKLFIFQDGIKESTNIDEWNAVGNLIENQNWCDTEVIRNEKNKGLAKSIISGVNYVLQQYDAVIVLEDDCVSHPVFMDFMYACLEKYEYYENVFSVSGWSDPIDLSYTDQDVYWCQRISSLGWGTWKAKWKYFQEDYTLLRKMKSDEEINQRLQIWGSDLESQLIGNVQGVCNSWAVFWALKVIEMDGYSLNPVKSMIKNIGFDGTGVHSNFEGLGEDLRDENDMRSCRLPETVECMDECKKAYSEYLYKLLGVNRNRVYKEFLLKWVSKIQTNREFRLIPDNHYGTSIAIWGKGAICDLILREVENVYKVVCILDSNPAEKEYKGIPVLSLEKIPEEVGVIYVVPFYDKEKIRKKISLTGNGVCVVGIDELV